MCAIFGVFNDDEAAECTILGLRAMQSRATDYAGLAVDDGKIIRRESGRGLVMEALTPDKIAACYGFLAIGHTRYTTSGDDPDTPEENSQPIVRKCRDGSSFAIAHNGNITNPEGVLQELGGNGDWRRTAIDTELIAERFARSSAKTTVDRLREALTGVAGTYSILLIHDGRLIAVRDYGANRPLVIGSKHHRTYVASETSALERVEATYERSVSPGEIVTISAGGIRTLPLDPSQKTKPCRRICVFEGVYYAHPLSLIENGDDTTRVSAYRFALGQALATEAPANVDVVVPVPDSANRIADGFRSKTSGARRDGNHGLLRDHYVGRTFIRREQKDRVNRLAMKFTADPDVVGNQRVAVVDDSVVRLNTLPFVVRLLRAAGAREVHVRIGSPPITGPCHYGINTPTRDELIAPLIMDDFLRGKFDQERIEEEIRRRVGANSLRFLSIDKFKSISAAPDTFCYACMAEEERPEIFHEPGNFTPDLQKEEP